MKIKYYPNRPHCMEFGGFDIQLLNTMEAVKKAGVDASKLDIWDRDNRFDVIHIWGIGPHNYRIIDWANRAGKKIVATVLLPYFDSFRTKMGYYLRSFTQQKLMLHYYSLVDRIVIVNELQSHVLSKYFNIHSSKIDVIPNIVENKYFETPVFNFTEKYAIQNYILCTGNICSRKNQYNLAKACINLNLNLVLIGNILDSELQYGEALNKLIERSKNIKWIKELPNASEELVSAYYSSTLFALPSKAETQPISALEAVAMGKPLVLMDKKYAYQRYYKGAILCKSTKVTDIENALKNALKENISTKVNTEILNCKEENVGNMYKDCYLKLEKDFK
jgi:glycosyltransferase involved in cell wall biosynthesis